MSTSKEKLNLSRIGALAFRWGYLTPVWTWVCCTVVQVTVLLTVLNSIVVLNAR